VWWNVPAAVLEGNTFTFPEVQTLLDGITVGGRRLSEQDQVLRLADAANRLRSFVASGTFTLTKPTSDDLHAAVATNEAGHFRGEGDAGGPDSAVTVRLGESGVYVAPPAGVGGSNLTGIFEAGIDQIGQIAEPFHQALVYFSFAALQQFYFDGNKRTARLMCCGHLMSHGYEAISVPAARKLEFNQTMVDFYVARDATALLAFLASCAIS
jgi:Fic family protein